MSTAARGASGAMRGLARVPSPMSGMRFAAAVLADAPYHYNWAHRAHAGRLLARCHAAKGEHSLAVAASDGAEGLAKTGHFVLSELMAVRGRAVAGKEAGGVGPYWGAEAGEARVAEVLGRMELGGHVLGGSWQA